MADKKFDPLWEIVDEKIALQNVDSDVDLTCPHCGVPLHLGPGAPQGRRVACGLCGGSSEVVEIAGSLRLKSQ